MDRLPRSWTFGRRCRARYSPQRQSIAPDGRGEYGFVTGQKAFDFKKRSPRYIRKMILSYHAGPAVSKKLSPQINLFEGRHVTIDVCGFGLQQDRPAS
jgi:hypothetical protein